MNDEQEDTRFNYRFSTSRTSRMSSHYPRIILAGAHSGVGKTTIACALMSALAERRLAVQPFKAGPDYIDPGYHTLVTGKPSFNLDTWLVPRGAIMELFQWSARGADLSIIEGVMGLYDGLQDTEDGSTAALAKMLNCPVVLIQDARSLSRSAAAVALGYREFDKKLSIRGILLNNIGSVSHYQYIKSSIETKTKIPVLGYLPKDSALKLPERHLGLIPAWEGKLRSAYHSKLSRLVKDHIDLDRILTIANRAPRLPCIKKRIFNPRASKTGIAIGLARDKAFNFYYQHNLDILGHLGAKLVAFSPLKHAQLPRNVGGVYIGGGFPELFAEQLSKNVELKKDIFKKAKDGMPIYAECGGLMYLVKRLVDFKKREFPMVGIFNGSVRMGNRRRALGYVLVDTIKDTVLSRRGARMRAHLFHWSHFDGLARNTSAYKIFRAAERKKPAHEDKRSCHYDGLVKENTLASYAHLHFASNVNLAKNFITHCERYRAANGKKNKSGM